MAIFDPIKAQYLHIARAHPHEITGNLKYNATKQRSRGKLETNIVFSLDDAYYIEYVNRKSNFIENAFLSIASYTETFVNTGQYNDAFLSQFSNNEDGKSLMRELRHQESLEFARGHTATFDNEQGRVIYNVLSK